MLGMTSQACSLGIYFWGSIGPLYTTKLKFASYAQHIPINKEN